MALLGVEIEVGAVDLAAAGPDEAEAGAAELLDGALGVAVCSLDHSTASSLELSAFMSGKAGL